MHGGWGATISLVCLPLAYPVAWLMVIRSMLCTQQPDPPTGEEGTDLVAVDHDVPVDDESVAPLRYRGGYQGLVL